MAKKQREIKFKAWDKKEKKIIEIYSMDACLSGGDFSNAHEDIILMQFTGLLDKKGKEIFEGDIIEMTDSPSNYTDKGDEIKTHWEVVFDSGSFSLKNGEKEYSDFEDCYGGEIFLGNSWKYGEIIGNIYESKYLLDNIDTKKTPKRNGLL